MRVFHLLASIGLPICAGLAAGSCGSSSGPSLPPGTGVRLAEIVSGLDFPLYLTAPPGDLRRLFIVERTGDIRIVKDGALLPNPFASFKGAVSLGSEQGLLGLAFPLDYATSGRFVVHYTLPQGTTRLSLLQVSSDPDVADQTSEQVLQEVDQPFPNHNGGQLAFGPDGFLYFGLGDGGGSGDPGERGQNLQDNLGAILRWNLPPGSVPDDNPFVGQPGVNDLIWSYGLRNPWRFSFDRGTGDLYIADVGEHALEEINVAPAAEGAGRAVNYGWSIMEGNQCFNRSQCDQTGLTLPTLQYSHSEGCSIIGGYVYRGSALPDVQGVYFYGDYCEGWVRSFRYTDGVVTEETDWPSLRPGGFITSFGEDTAGELYVLSSGGGVFKFIPDP
jgi:glucose/arabinose dehydrogenase